MVEGRYASTAACRGHRKPTVPSADIKESLAGEIRVTEHQTFLKRHDCWRLHARRDNALAEIDRMPPIELGDSFGQRGFRFHQIPSPTMPKDHSNLTIVPVRKEYQTYSICSKMPIPMSRRSSLHTKRRNIFGIRCSSRAISKM